MIRKWNIIALHSGKEGVELVLGFAVRPGSLASQSGIRHQAGGESGHGRSTCGEQPSVRARGTRCGRGYRPSVWSFVPVDVGWLVSRRWTGSSAISNEQSSCCVLSWCVGLHCVVLWSCPSLGPRVFASEDATATRTGNGRRAGRQPREGEGGVGWPSLGCVCCCAPTVLKDRDDAETRAQRHAAPRASSVTGAGVSPRLASLSNKARSRSMWRTQALEHSPSVVPPRRTGQPRPGHGHATPSLRLSASLSPSSFIPSALAMQQRNDAATVTPPCFDSDWHGDDVTSSDVI